MYLDLILEIISCQFDEKTRETCAVHVKMSFKIPFLMNVIDVFPHTKYKT